MGNTLELDLNEAEEFLEIFEEDTENIRRVRKTLDENDVDSNIFFHGKSMSAEKSAERTGFETSQIVKSLVFVGDQPFVCLVPGDKRVDEQKLEDLTGSKVEMADPETVKSSTGYVVGGVSPFDLDIPVYMEEGLIEHDTVKPAAGSKVTGVGINPGKMAELADAELEDIVE